MTPDTGRMTSGSSAVTASGSDSQTHSTAIAAVTPAATCMPGVTPLGGGPQTNAANTAGARARPTPFRADSAQPRPSPSAATSGGGGAGAAGESVRAALSSVSPAVMVPRDDRARRPGTQMESARDAR